MYSCRLGFGTKKHLSYVHFLSAFEDPRYAQNPPAKLDSRSSVSSKVSFDSVQDLTPEEAIAKLRKTVLQNAESIKSVSDRLVIAFAFHANLIKVPLWVKKNFSPSTFEDWHISLDFHLI